MVRKNKIKEENALEVRTKDPFGFEKLM